MKNIIKVLKKYCQNNELVRDCILNNSKELEKIFIDFVECVPIGMKSQIVYSLNNVRIGNIEIINSNVYFDVYILIESEIHETGYRLDLRNMEID
jgi:hypothetical protein